MKKFLIWAVVVIVVILSAFVYFRYIYTYSEGYRSGLLQKFSYKGNIFKTYEGEIILSSIESNKNVALASEKFLFSVTDVAVAKQLELMQGKAVTVHYKEKHGRIFWRGETVYYVDGVHQ
jgi:hypothetical protein